MGSRLARWKVAGILALSVSTIACALNEAAPPPARRPGNQAVVKKGCDLSPAYNAYLGRLQNKVLSHWNTLLADGKNNVTLAATVGNDGGVTGVNVRSTPSNAAAEQAALDAFNASQPLETLPTGSPPVVITFTFVSTYDPHGDSNSSLSARIAPLSAPSASPPSSSYQAPSSSPASSSSSSTYTAPETSTPSSSSTSSTSYPTGGGMPSDLGLGSVLPPDKDGGQAASPPQSTTPQTAPASTGQPQGESQPGQTNPGANAVPAQEGAKSAETQAIKSGKEAASAPESAPSSTPTGSSPQGESSTATGSGDTFTPPGNAPQTPQGSEGAAATYDSNNP